MAFSFAPGQQPLPQNSTDVPALVVPAIPTIATNVAPVEQISPFAFRNRNKSNFSMYFQFAVFAIFGVVVTVTIALFVYKGYLNSKIESKKIELSSKQSGFKAVPYEDMKKLSDRLALVNKTMNERASVVTALSILEDSIFDTVTYTRFDLARNQTKGIYTVGFAGETSSYKDLYQQVEALRSKSFATYLSPIEIRLGGALDKKGMTSFKVDGTIKIQGLPYDATPINKSTATSTATVASSTQDVVAPPSTNTVLPNSN